MFASVCDVGLQRWFKEAVGLCSCRQRDFEMPSTQDKLKTLDKARPMVSGDDGARVDGCTESGTERSLKKLPEPRSNTQIFCNTMPCWSSSKCHLLATSLAHTR